MDPIQWNVNTAENSCSSSRIMTATAPKAKRQKPEGWNNDMEKEPKKLLSFFTEGLDRTNRLMYYKYMSNNPFITDERLLRDIAAAASEITDLWWANPQENGHVKTRVVEEILQKKILGMVVPQKKHG
jgi:hypothetical protein